MSALWTYGPFISSTPLSDLHERIGLLGQGLGSCEDFLYGDEGMEGEGEGSGSPAPRYEPCLSRGLVGVDREGRELDNGAAESTLCQSVKGHEGQHDDGFRRWT